MKVPPTAADEASHNLSRREFLERATLGSAAFAAAPQLAASASGTGIRKVRTKVPAYGRLASIAPGAVKTEGWLELYLQKQAKQLGSQLESVSWPFTESYWAGQEPSSENEWWPWEQKGYWIDGALRCGLVLQDESLLRQTRPSVDYTLNHAMPDGYMGPPHLHDFETPGPPPSDIRWPHNVFFRALAAYGEATRDPRVAEAVRRHYLADKDRLAIYGGNTLSVTNVEGMLWAYQQTGDSTLLTMAKQVWAEFLRSNPSGDRESGDLHPERVLAGTRIRAHGVVYSEKAKLPTILYLHTGDPEYLRYAIAAHERMFTHHMLIDGLPSSTEDFRGVSALDAHETCNISSMTWGWGYLLMATGDGLWADRIERACFNAGFGSIRKDWKGVQYFSCPNQVIATDDSSHVPYQAIAAGWMAYRPNPGHHVACCGANVHRFLPNYAIRMWMSDGNGGLAAVLYGPSSVRAEVGPRNELIEIHQETNYPFDEAIHFTIRSERAVTFPLSLRIPSWCEAPQLTLNGGSLKLPPKKQGFVCIERTFQPGDRITLTLPMRTKVSFWPGTWAYSGIGLEHGPLVYALPVKENWTSAVTPRYSTAEFPEWNATAASAWNYGVATHENMLGAEAKVERVAMTDDPWVDPPVRLVVPLRKIPGWTLRPDPSHPDRMQTPPLPVPEENSTSNQEVPEVEQVALVPYGSTQLRLTVLPRA